MQLASVSEDLLGGDLDRRGSLVFDSRWARERGRHVGDDNADCVKIGIEDTENKGVLGFVCIILFSSFYSIFSFSFFS